MKRARFRLWAGVLAACLLFGPTISYGQDVEFQEKEQATIVGATERKVVERKTIEEEEGSGPKVDFETDEMAMNAIEAEKMELQESAIRKLTLRIRQTDDDDPAKPELMERMGDMLWQKARFYDLRSFDMLNLARQAELDGDKAKSESYKAKEEADKQTARDARDEMLKLYRDIIKYHSDFHQIDKIRYYMAFNLASMGYAGEAYEQYSGIVREHSNSRYLAEAFLGMAEYTFTIEEDMPLALQQYQKVVSIDPNSTAASFAMYKMGWCYFNLGEPKRALAQFEKVIRSADKSNARSDMRKEALKDLVKAYSMWEEARAGNARKYFKSFAQDEDEVNDMLERLARHYQGGGRVDDSNHIYSQLIASNMGKFKIVGYQHEIMLNVETQSDPSKLAQEINRTVLLFAKARDEKFEGITKEMVDEEYNKLEVYVSETAKWYHQTFITTKNPLYYSLAFEIYKTYIDHFDGASNNYEIMYYYSDMAYFRGNFAEAAKGYEKVLDINEKGEFSKEAAHGAVLAYDRLLKSGNEEDKEVCPDVPETPLAEAGEEQTYPEFPIADCRLNFIKASERYAKIDTSAEFAINAKFSAAKIYFDHNHYKAARPLFYSLTEENPEHEFAVFSADFLLETYRRLGEYEAMSKAIDKMKANTAFMANSTELMPELRAQMQAYEEALDFKFCEEKEKNKQWEAAARCYEKFAQNHKGSVEAAKALWNASVAWEQNSEVGRAIESRVALLTSGETDENTRALAPRALYAIALNYHGLAVFSEAARFYEMFVKQFPDDREACVAIGAEPSKEPCAKIALQNAAAFRSGLGEYEKAVENYDLFAKMFPKDKNEMSMLKFQTGRIYYDQKKYDQAIDRFRDYLKNYARLGVPGRQVAAHTYIGKAYWNKKMRRDALKSFEEAEKLYSGRTIQSWLSEAEPADADMTRNAAAEARFMRGETLFVETLEIQLSDDKISKRRIERYLQEQLKKKGEKMNEAVPIYTDVITRFNSPKWGLASMARLGMLYHDTAYQIENAPVPPGLQEEVELAYVDLLLDFSAQFEGQAIKFYEAAVSKATETGWFSEYTAEAQKRLFDLRPLEYRSASEVKAMPNKVIATYHTSDLFTDLEELRGNVIKERRKVAKELREEDISATSEVTSEESEAQ